MCSIKIIIVVAISLALRLYVAYGGYSGANHPPKYGDFEAQRHWMELTVNSPPSSWYIQSEFNDLNWWRIDYPPLSAYFAWIWGQISNFYDPKIIEPYTSRGLETNNVKFMMRISVILSELIFLYPPLIYFAMKSEPQHQIYTLTFILCSPLLILIDHGHFQYNCVMLGLILYSVILLEKRRIYFGSILYVMALNFKIMGLYYSLPIFVYILTILFKKSSSFLYIALNIAKVGSVVLITTLLIWIPYLNESFIQTLQAIFPVHRGLYQLHVGTFWCLSHVVIKWNILFDNETLFKISSILTLLACLPILYKLFRQPNQFKISLFTISQAFFLFSFHVHEKTILLPLIFILINYHQFGLLAVDYAIIATITHHPLMIEDKLVTEYFILLTLYYLIFGIRGKIHQNIPILNQNCLKIYRLTRNIPFVFYLIISFCKLYIPPPLNYPYIYDLLIQGIGFYIYSLVFIISHFFSKQDLMNKKQKKS